MLPVPYWTYKIGNFEYIFRILMFWHISSLLLSYFLCVDKSLTVLSYIFQNTRKSLVYWLFACLSMSCCHIAVFREPQLLCKNPPYIWSTNCLSYKSCACLLPGCCCLSVWHLVQFGLARFWGIFQNSLFLVPQEDHVTRLWQCGTADSKWRWRIRQGRLWKGERGKLLRRKTINPILNGFISWSKLCLLLSFWRNL